MIIWTRKTRWQRRAIEDVIGNDRRHHTPDDRQDHGIQGFGHINLFEIIRIHG